MPRRTMVEYIEKKALELTMMSGMRHLESLKFVLDVTSESRCIGNLDSPLGGEELEGIIEFDVETRTAYEEYDRKMREAGLKK